MALIALTSVAGSPGVTTTAVAWALHSTRPTLLLEADPVGGSSILAGVLRGTLPHEKSVLSVPARPRHKTVLEQLMDQRVELAADSGRFFIPGVLQHAQARSMSSEWHQIALALKEYAQSGDSDVVIDMGRAGLQHYASELLVHTDYVVAMARTDLPSLNAAHTAVQDLKSSLGEGDVSRVGMALVTAAREPYSTREARAVFEPVTVLGEIPYDPHNAAVYSLGGTPRSTRTLRSWTRSISALIEATHAASADHAELLEGR